VDVINARQKILNKVKVSKTIDQSGLVNSSQTGVHPDLENCLRRHLDTPWSQPFHQPTLDAYQRLENEGVLSEGLPLVLDSGCGTGKSTQWLADRFPGHVVIGVDRSYVRLAKSSKSPDFFRNGNCILLRAELSTFWRLMLNDGRLPERHYLLYPNPWPKPGHLLRRWHGHPVFPYLLALGGEIELRCNWEIYALEFARAVSIATGMVISAKKIHPDSGISLFEQKYLERGQALFSVLVPAHITKTFDNFQPAT
jgi:tRNA G46 methylase TrmB